MFRNNLVGFYWCPWTLWATAKLNPQISLRRVPDILYPIFCFQQAFWLNIRHSMSPLKNIYIFRRIFLRQKLKNRAKIEKSVKIKNWQMNFFGFFSVSLVKMIRNIPLDFQNSENWFLVHSRWLELGYGPKIHQKWAKNGYFQNFEKSFKNYRYCLKETWKVLY